METSRIAPRIAAENQNWVFALGGSPVKYFPARIAKRVVLEFAYDYVVQVSGFLPLAPKGSTAPYPAGTQPPWVDDVILTLTSIKNVPNLFTLTTKNEAIQVFWGVTPSPTALYKRQPVNENNVALDQNVYATLSYYDPGLIDGFASPFDRPAPETETWILGGIDANWAIGNEGAFPLSPKLNFLFVHCTIEPITDAETIRRIFLGQIPARWTSLGAPDKDVSSSLNTTLYSNPSIVTRAQALAPAGGGP